MERFNIFFEYSAFWIIPALAVAAFFTWLLYRRSTTFDVKVRKGLSVLRFLLISILLILLISPIIRQIINHYEQPLLIVAIDNSVSITQTEDSTELVNSIERITASLKGEYTIEYRTLNKKIEDLEKLSFQSLTTDLHSMFSDISNDYENRNLAAVILLSDGLFNQGLNPVYSRYAYPVYAIGLGDTTTYSDIGISQLRYNKLSYQGNKIPIQVEITHEGFAGREVTVSVINNGKTVAKKDITITQARGIQSELFLIDAKEKGLQHYQIVINSPLKEKNNSNNRKAAFIDVVEGKKNVLVIAPYPHPDLKALESAITTNENYELTQYIPVLNNQNVQQILNQPFDLVIMHQLPNSRLINDPVYKRFATGDHSRWWITGAGINFQFFNQLNKTIKVAKTGNQTDAVTAWFSQNFSAFSLSEDLKNIFNSLPPVNVPFGAYEVQSGASIFLYQQVGRVQTKKPLFITSATDDLREGVFLGDGLWKWRLYEYAQSQSHEKFNELIIKTVQYLSTREDKRKFRFYPTKNEFNEGEQVMFESEVYNDLYEPVYGQQINIELKDAEDNSRSYQYVTTENNSRYAISGLSPGIYSYNARTTFNNNTMEISGEIAVNVQDIENTRLSADYDILKQLSNNTGGNFYPLEKSEMLVEDLNQKDFKDRIQTSEDFLPLINIKWIGILLLLLVSIEWITRKYHGAY